MRQLLLLVFPAKTTFEIYFLSRFTCCESRGFLVCKQEKINSLVIQSVISLLNDSTLAFVARGLNEIDREKRDATTC